MSQNRFGSRLAHNLYLSRKMQVLGISHWCEGHPIHSHLKSSGYRPTAGFQQWQKTPQSAVYNAFEIPLMWQQWSACQCWAPDVNISASSQLCQTLPLYLNVMQHWPTWLSLSEIVFDCFPSTSFATFTRRSVILFSAYHLDDCWKNLQTDLMADLNVFRLQNFKD